MTDAELLEAALASDDISDEAREAFEDMQAKCRPLSPKQRAWLEAAIEGHRYEAPDEEPPKPASAYPRGKEVELPPVLRNLPLKPPGRRAS
jgi:DNA topoisomerase IB